MLCKSLNLKITGKCVTVSLCQSLKKTHRGLHHSNGHKNHNFVGRRTTKAVMKAIFCLSRIYIQIQKYTHTHTGYFLSMCLKNRGYCEQFNSLKGKCSTYDYSKRTVVSLLLFTTFETSDKFLITVTN